MSFFFTNKAVAAESVATYGSQVATASAAIAVAAGAAAAGPALPIIASIAVLAAAGARIYAQNKALAKLFIRTEKMIRKIESLLVKMYQISQVRKFDIDVSAVRTALDELLLTIARISGPNTIRQIQSDGGVIVAAKPPGYWSKFIRKIIPGDTIQTFRNQIVDLAIAFSILQSEFAIQLDAPGNEDLAAQASQPSQPNPANPAKTLEDIANAVGADPENPVGGSRRTTRHRKANRRRKTFRLSSKRVYGSGL
jgi:hypothetical protein